MSLSRTEIATRKILEMQACIENNDKPGFIKVFTGGVHLEKLHPG